MANPSLLRSHRDDVLDKPGRIKLLGPPQATWRGTNLLLSDRMFAVVAYLALQPQHAARREVIRTLVFGDADATKANNSFRQSLSRIRRLQDELGVDLLSIRGDVLSLRIEHFTFDLLDFVRADPEAAFAGGEGEGLKMLFNLYTGDLLEGSRVTGGPFDDWLMGQRQKMADRFLGVAHRVLDTDSGLGDDDLLDLARRVAVVQPESASACRASILVNIRRKRKATAPRVQRLCGPHKPGVRRRH